MNLGVFGGTFNPVHLAHLRVAEEVREAVRLDRVLFVPARLPPHKRSVEVASPAERLAMVRDAVAGNPGFEVSDLELRREGPSYSVDTLEALRSGLGHGDQLWFLLGADSFRDIHTWHRYREIFRVADLAVMRRPPDLGHLPPPPGMAGALTATDGGYRHDSGHEVRFVPVTLLDISSTQIRRSLAEGRSVRYLVPDAVRARLRPCPGAGPLQDGDND
ncbi:MAG: nicotinate (nicotinamide) nucleotide adenylyltransferase [Deltaproteobacteria bacterium]|nr:nicotinate (nicotinamide) nucleotide adenylyltransferase [Deltaproteobacteria bacterium]